MAVFAQHIGQVLRMKLVEMNISNQQELFLHYHSLLSRFEHLNLLHLSQQASEILKEPSRERLCGWRYDESVPDLFQDDGKLHSVKLPEACLVSAACTVTPQNKRASMQPHLRFIFTSERIFVLFMTNIYTIC